jgi:hypothetical protein
LLDLSTNLKKVLTGTRFFSTRTTRSNSTSNFIGQDLSNLPLFRKELFGYAALIDNKLRDEKIRRDPGVRWIETNMSWFDIVLFDSQEDLCEKTGSGCNTGLYTNSDPVWQAPTDW